MDPSLPITKTIQLITTNVHQPDILKKVHAGHYMDQTNYGFSRSCLCITMNAFLNFKCFICSLEYIIYIHSSLRQLKTITILFCEDIQFFIVIIVLYRYFRTLSLVLHYMWCFQNYLFFGILAIISGCFTLLCTCIS